MATNTITRANLFNARFKDAPWYMPNGTSLSCSIGGVGGIGSWLALLLARMGCVLNLFDPDVVEEHNIGGQLYSEDFIGEPKVAAINAIITNLCPQHGAIYLYYKKMEAGDDRKVTFLAFDNMEARIKMSDEWYDHFGSMMGLGITEDPVVLIDGRMEAESAIIYCVESHESYERYVSELFTDDQVPSNPCSFRATSHNPAIMAGLMVGMLNNHIVNKLAGEVIREVPYKMEYELPTFTFDAKR